MELKEFVYQELVGTAKVRVFDLRGKLISEHSYLNDFDLHFVHAFEVKEKPKAPRKKRPRIKRKAQSYTYVVSVMVLLINKLC